jgi:hypothetical protein
MPPARQQGALLKLNAQILSPRLIPPVSGPLELCGPSPQIFKNRNLRCRRAVGDALFVARTKRNDLGFQQGERLAPHGPAHLIGSKHPFYFSGILPHQVGIAVALEVTNSAF